MEISEIKDIFEGVSKGKNTVSQYALLQYFVKNSFGLEGVKLSKLFKAQSITITDIDQKIEELCMSIDKRQINIAEICKKYDK